MMRLIGLLLTLVVVGGGAFLGVRLWLTSPVQEVSAPPESGPVVVEEKGVQVVVAKRRLAAGTLIQPSDLHWQGWPDEGIVEDYLVEGQVTLESLQGTVVHQWLAKGEPVTEAHLVRPGERGFLSAVLKPGYRAITINANRTNAVAGFVFPGDRVDLVLSDELVFTDIRVLAINQSTADQTENPKLPSLEVLKTITLEVTLEQAEAVLFAEGAPSLVLRSSLQAKEDTMPEYTDLDSDLSKPTPSVHLMQVVRGSHSVIEEVVRGSHSVMEEAGFPRDYE